MRAAHILRWKSRGGLVAHQNEVKLLVWSVCPHNVLGSRTGLLWNSSLGNRAVLRPECVQVMGERKRGKVAHQSQRKPRPFVKQVQVEPIDECKEQRQYIGHHVCAAKARRAMPSVGDACCTQRSPSLWPFDRSGDKNIVCRYHRVAAPAWHVCACALWGEEERKLD